MADAPVPRGKIVYLITEDWFFLSHFAERGLAARAAGYEIIVAAREGAAAQSIRNLGLRFAPIPFRRRSLEPIGEIATLRAIRDLYRRERPDIVHHVALKPILYGTAAARGPRIVNAPVGLGFTFTSTRLGARAIRPVVDRLLRRYLNPPGSRVIFENADDLAGFAASGAVRAEAALLIRGAGVDVDAIRPRPEPPAPPVRVLLVGRMLRTKGIVEFVEAARRLRAAGTPVEFVLAGAPDEQNPDSLSKVELRAWQESGLVTWLGFRHDVLDLMADSNIVALPSYREGLPKALIEAMAVGRPIVATDVPGCREAVTDGDNGLLVPPRDAAAFATAITRLTVDPTLRARMGARGRARAEAEFASRTVIAQTLSVYDALMK